MIGRSAHGSSCARPLGDDSRSLAKELELESVLLKPLLSGKDIERYGYTIPNQVLLFPYKVDQGKAELISPEQFASAYPRCWEYLLQHKKTLENREDGKMRHGQWYAYVYPKSLALHDKQKIMTGVLASKSRLTFDSDGVFYFMGGGNAGGYGIILKETNRKNYLYTLGLLNSSLLDLNLKKISSPFRGGFFSYARRYIEKLPIHCLDCASPIEKKRHDDLVALVDKMLKLNERLAPIRSTFCNEREELLRQIEQTDKEIDNLVYDLYGLTEEERKIVEGNG